jgi:hypothetical protein
MNRAVPPLPEDPTIEPTGLPLATPDDQSRPVARQAPAESGGKRPDGAHGATSGPPLSRLVWTGVLTLLGLLATWLGAGHWRGGVQMRELERLAALEQAAFDSRSALRPALWGATDHGAAWPHYEAAIADVAKLDSPLIARLCRMAAATLSGQPLREPPNQQPPAQSAAELVAAHTLALAELRAGAHAEDSRLPMTWSAGLSHRCHNLLTTRVLCNLAVLDAHQAARAGQGLVAVQRLLDAMQLGRDFLQAPILIDQMIGCALLAIAAREGVAQVDLWRHLDDAARAVLAEGLARLDASLPLDGEWLTSEAVLFANHFAQLKGSVSGAFFGTGHSDLSMRLQAWRYGCSLTLAVANHGLAHLAAGERLRELAAGKASLDMPAVTRLHDELSGSTNPVSRLCTPNLLSGTENRLLSLAQMRLLRMACQHARGEAVEALPDPHGGTLRCVVDDAGDATLWSDAQRKHTEFTKRR